MKKCARRRPPGDGTRLGEPVCRVFGTPRREQETFLTGRETPPPFPFARGREGRYMRASGWVRDGRRRSLPPAVEGAVHAHVRPGVERRRRRARPPRAGTRVARQRNVNWRCRVRRHRASTTFSRSSRSRSALSMAGRPRPKTRTEWFSKNGGDGRPEDRESHRPRLPKLLAAEEVDGRRRHEMPARKPLRR